MGGAADFYRAGRGRSLPAVVNIKGTSQKAPGARFWRGARHGPDLERAWRRCSGDFL